MGPGKIVNPEFHPCREVVELYLSRFGYPSSQYPGDRIADKISYTSLASKITTIAASLLSATGNPSQSD
jgi:hypothetical protein